MKIIVALFCFFAATTVLAQNSAGGGVLSNEPTMVEFTSHPNRATQGSMGQVQDVMERSQNTMSQGERPLWEVAPRPVEAEPLGDVARAFRQEKLTGKKATEHWENQ
jgi:hypothetical protein